MKAAYRRLVGIGSIPTPLLLTLFLSTNIVPLQSLRSRNRTKQQRLQSS